MVVDAWIGNLDSPNFDFYSYNSAGNIPKRESPFLPNAHELLRVLWKMKKDGEYNARQLDWGAWGAIMTKRELTDFIGEFYGEDRVPEVKKFVHELDEKKSYVLVAFESASEFDD